MLLEGSIHFHDGIDYNGITYSIELLDWSCTFSGFGRDYGVSLVNASIHFRMTYLKCSMKQMHKQKVTQLGSRKLRLSKSEKDGSLIDHKIYYNGVYTGSERPVAHT